MRLWGHVIFFLGLARCRVRNEIKRQILIALDLSVVLRNRGLEGQGRRRQMRSAIQGIQGEHVKATAFAFQLFDI